MNSPLMGLKTAILRQMFGQKNIMATLCSIERLSQVNLVSKLALNILQAIGSVFGSIEL